MVSHLGACVAQLGPSRGILGNLGGILTCTAPACVHLGGILADYGPSWGHLEAILGPTWAFLGALDPPKTLIVLWVLKGFCN